VHELIGGNRLAEQAGDIQIIEIAAGTRDDHDRNALRVTRRCKFVAYHEPVHSRQHEIEDDDVNGRGVEQPKRFEPAARFTHSITRHRQGSAIEMPQVLVVFDDQHGVPDRHGPTISEFSPSLKQSRSYPVFSERAATLFLEDFDSMAESECAIPEHGNHFSVDAQDGLLTRAPARSAGGELNPYALLFREVDLDHLSPLSP
jgi:hypothetical protein